MGDVQKVNVGRVLDKIQIAMKEFEVDDTPSSFPTYENAPQSNIEALRDAFNEYGATGLQTIVRGRRGDGEVEIRYSRHGMPGALLLNASGTLTDVGSQTETNVDYVAAQLFIAALFGEKELDADTGFAEDPQWRGAAAYAKCLLASLAPRCQSVLNKWKAPTEAAVADYNRVIAERKEREQIAGAERKEREQIAGYDNYARLALELVNNVRAKAKEKDSWFNKITPKDVDAVLGRHKPSIDIPAGATELEKAANRSRAAYAMLAELFQTKTGKALFWHVSSPLFEQSMISTGNIRACDRSGYREDVTETHSIAGITRTIPITKEFDCVDDPPPKEIRDWGSAKPIRDDWGSAYDARH